MRRGGGGNPSTLDPSQAIDTFTFDVLRDIFEGLTTESPAGSVVPGIADSWQVDSSGKRYVFKLRSDAKWSDGTQVKAQDFIVGWRKVVDPKTASPLADILRPIKYASEIIAGKLPPESLAVEAPDSLHLIVNLSEPAPYFPQLLAHPATFPMSPSILSGKRNDDALISNGPYILKKWIPGHEIELEKNHLYWNQTEVRIENVIYKPITNEETELNLYRSGELDITANVPVAALPMIHKEFPTELHISPFLGVYYYAFNLRKDPFKSSLKLRKSLSMALDRDSIQSSLLPFNQLPAYGFVPPETWNFTPQSWEWKDAPAEARHAEARKLYKESGFSAERPLKIRLLFNTNPSLKRIAIATAAMWSTNLGVQCQLIDEEYRVFLESRKDADHWDVIRLGWTADFNDATNFLDTFRSNSPNNDAGYSNPEFDLLLESASHTADPAIRKSTLERAERIMLADYPITPIYFYTSKRLIKPYVVGEIANPLNRIYSKHLYLTR